MASTGHQLALYIAVNFLWVCIFLVNAWMWMCEINSELPPMFVNIREMCSVI